MQADGLAGLYLAFSTEGIRRNFWGKYLSVLFISELGIHLFCHFISYKGHWFSGHQGANKG